MLSRSRISFMPSSLLCSRPLLALSLGAGLLWLPLGCGGEDGTPAGSEPSSTGDEPERAADPDPASTGPGDAGGGGSPAGTEPEDGDRGGAPPEGATLWFTEEAVERGIAGLNHCGSADKKVYAVEEIGQGCALFDADGDGDLDAYVADGCTLLPPGSEVDAPADQLPPLTNRDWRPAFDGTSRLYANDGAGHFLDVSETSGTDYRGMACAAVPFDFDGDGDPDLYVTAWGPNRLYRNEGELQFSDISAASGTDDDHWSAGACVLDMDRDGHLDLFVANYFSLTSAEQEDVWDKIACPYLDMEVACGPRTMLAHPDTLLRNRGDGSFEDLSETHGVRDAEPRYGLGCVAFDHDLDGDTDIYVANDSRGNYLWNNEGGKFEQWADFLGLSLNADGIPQAGMGVGCADYDNDLDLDLFLTNFAYDDNTLYRNEGSTLFRDITRRLSFGEASFFSLGWGTDFADFDQDGRLELYVSNGHVFPEADQRKDLSYKQLNRLFQGGPEGSLKDRTTECGPGFARLASSRGACFGDVDGDGDLDILVNELNERPSLLINQGGSHSGASLFLSLEGKGPNRAAIGAQVIVRFGEHQRRIEQRIGASFGSAHDPRIHVGLGSAGQLDAVEITWPDGETQSFEGLEAGHWHHIRQEGAALRSEELR